MWKEMVLLNGTIERKDGQKLDADVLFRILSENGYEYEGGYQTVKHDDLREAIKQIVDAITEDSLGLMIEKLHRHYGEMNADDIEHFFLSNFGSQSFDQVFKVALTADTNKLYQKYINLNWQVSDTFGSELGEAVVKKFGLDTQFTTSP